MNRECRGDLLLRARRAAASESDRLALEAHLSMCSSCRMTDSIAREFDAVGHAEVDDAARLARMAAYARRKMGRGRARSGLWTRTHLPFGRSGRLALAAVLFAGAGLAGTRAFWQLRSELTSYEIPSARIVVSPRAPAGPGRVGAGPVPSVRAIDESGLDGATTTRRQSRSEASSAPAQLCPAAEPSVRSKGSLEARSKLRAVAHLFLEANDARRAGDAPRAIRLYRRLQRQFPGSPEAALASVSLGGLLLDSGSIAAALVQYDRCLASPGQCRLGAEALYGRARALESAGRHTEQVQTWQRLLDEYPRSPYAAHARRQLAKLR